MIPYIRLFCLLLLLLLFQCVCNIEHTDLILSYRKSILGGQGTDMEDKRQQGIWDSLYKLCVFNEVGTEVFIQVVRSVTPTHISMNKKTC